MTTSSAGGGPVGVAVVGTGNICPEYLSRLTTFPDLAVLWVAGRNQHKAAEIAARYGVPHAGTIDDALADPAVEIVVNLTTPDAHFAVGMAALAAGKHLWSEKPIATSSLDATRLLEEARRRHLLIGVAPDSVLSPPAQSMVARLATGDIGRPVLITVAYQSEGPESWHPDPEFVYDHGAGPLFDVGPYFVTGMVQLAGPVRSVSAVSTRSAPTRRIGSGPRAGTEFPVNVPTTVAAVLEFGSGAIGRAMFSFDGVGPAGGEIEVIGTTGRLSSCGEILYESDVILQRSGEQSSTLEPHTPSFRRGFGVLDLARAIRTGGPVRTSGDMAAHVLDILAGIDRAARIGGRVIVESSAPAGEPLPDDWSPDTMTTRRTPDPSEN